MDEFCCWGGGEREGREEEGREEGWKGGDNKLGSSTYNLRSYILSVPTELFWTEIMAHVLLLVVACTVMVCVCSGNLK